MSTLYLLRKEHTLPDGKKGKHSYCASFYDPSIGVTDIIEEHAMDDFAAQFHKKFIENRSPLLDGNVLGVKPADFPFHHDQTGRREYKKFKYADQITWLYCLKEVDNPEANNDAIAKVLAMLRDTRDSS